MAVLAGLGPVVTSHIDSVAVLAPPLELLLELLLALLDEELLDEELLDEGLLDEELHAAIVRSAAAAAAPAAVGLSQRRRTPRRTERPGLSAMGFLPVAVGHSSPNWIRNFY